MLRLESYTPCKEGSEHESSEGAEAELTARGVTLRAWCATDRPTASAEAAPSSDATKSGVTCAAQRAGAMRRARDSKGRGALPAVNGYKLLLLLLAAGCWQAVRGWRAAARCALPPFLPAQSPCPAAPPAAPRSPGPARPAPQRGRRPGIGALVRERPPLGRRRLAPGRVQALWGGRPHPPRAGTACGTLGGAR